MPAARRPAVSCSQVAHAAFHQGPGGERVLNAFLRSSH